MSTPKHSLVCLGARDIAGLRVARGDLDQQRAALLRARHAAAEAGHGGRAGHTKADGGEARARRVRRAEERVVERVQRVLVDGVGRRRRADVEGDAAQLVRRDAAEEGEDLGDVVLCDFGREGDEGDGLQRAFDGFCGRA